MIWPEVITGVVTVLSVLITSYFNSKKTTAIQTSVDGNLTQAQNRNDQLTAAMVRHSVPIPDAPKPEA